MRKKRSIPMTALTLARSGYRPLAGSGSNKNGLPHFARHEKTGNVICLSYNDRTYRPMGKLITIKF